tara:strand:- start:154 stop:423 length:270 start_codon:yes stop_codon:yes gene_type:complete
MYHSIRDLPVDLRRRLPTEACELYLATYNRLCEKVGAADGGEDQAAIERAAHDGAMLAVQTEFEQRTDGSWTRASIVDDMEEFQQQGDR